MKMHLVHALPVPIVGLELETIFGAFRMIMDMINMCGPLGQGSSSQADMSRA